MSTQSGAKPPFRFDATKSPQENFDLFYKHLEESHGDLAKLLREQIEALMALPSGVERNTARAKINAKVAEFLDRRPEDVKKEPQ